MLTINHLYDSRSERLLYAASALHIPHQVKAYARDAETGAAHAAFKTLHPLGTAPVIQHGNIVIAESGAALTYMAEMLAGGNGLPAPGDTYYKCIELVHFVEGSLLANLMAYALRKGGADAEDLLLPIVVSRLRKNLDFLESTLGDQHYICGDALTIADAMLAFSLDLITGVCFPGLFELAEWHDYPTLKQYAERLRDNAHYTYSKRRDF